MISKLKSFDLIISFELRGNEFDVITKHSIRSFKYYDVQSVIFKKSSSLKTLNWLALISLSVTIAFFTSIVYMLVFILIFRLISLRQVTLIQIKLTSNDNIEFKYRKNDYVKLSNQINKINTKIIKTNYRFLKVG